MKILKKINLVVFILLMGFGLSSCTLFENEDSDDNDDNIENETELEEVEEPKLKINRGVNLGNFSESWCLPSQPVEPKPPSPRCVSDISVTTCISAFVTGAITICAILSPLFIVKGSLERLTIGTHTSPL